MTKESLATPSFLLHSLQLNQLRVSTPCLQETFVIPTFNHLALIDDIDDVCILDSAETVCNRDCGSAFADSVESFLDDFLGC
jgi:hypothetical protein